MSPSEMFTRKTSSFAVPEWATDAPSRASPVTARASEKCQRRKSGDPTDGLFLVRRGFPASCSLDALDTGNLPAHLMPELPSGTVTLLFTDIEGSTRLL